jgi:hypothetical protein
MTPASDSKGQPNPKGIPIWGWALIGVAICALIYKLALEPLAQIVKQHALIAVICFLVIIGLTVWACLHLRKRLDQLEEENVKLRNTLLSKNYHEYKDNHDIIRWGTEKEIMEWKKEDKLFRDILEAIRLFTPSKRYPREEPYKVELQGCLRTRFRQSKIEIQKGQSRPDIVIDHIAIEVKGPTDDDDLMTIPGKCEKYLKHWEQLIVVFFEREYSPETWDEYIRPLPKQYGYRVELVPKERISEVRNG